MNMNYELLIIFVALNIANVIIQTVKSIATIKCGKGLAAIVNAIAYGLYTVVVVYTVCELPLWLKVLVVGGANLVGVFLVKWGEEKAKKDKMWMVKITIPADKAKTARNLLRVKDIPFTYYDVCKYYVFDTFCNTQAETAKVLDICKVCGGKAFATENKIS